MRRISLFLMAVLAVMIAAVPALAQPAAATEAASSSSGLKAIAAGALRLLYLVERSVSPELAQRPAKARRVIREPRAVFKR